MSDGRNVTGPSPRSDGERSLIQDVASMHPEDVAEPIREAARRLLAMTIATENGRTFNDRADFGQCLYFLAVLTDDPTWDFLRGG